MRKRTSLIAMSTFGILSLGLSTESAGGGFDWMNPNRWFGGNNRDYDRDYYRGYGYHGYGYPGYGYPGWGGYGYPGWGGYPAATYPGYVYPVQPQQQNNPPAPAPAPAPTPQ